ncbi:MAG: hydroxymethylbilane synthase [Verrucomicrobiota bacterium]
MNAETVILASRRSRLARAQAAIVERAVIDLDPSWVTGVLCLTTTGDREASWSLEKQGGKGLFTKEIEEALLAGEADLAVHSAKDLPTDMPDGLCLAAFLPREDPRDVLILREGVKTPSTIATGSPRRRAQLKLMFPEAEFSEIRGNVETRLRKIGEGAADATVLAAAGLSRLGISKMEGLQFRKLQTDQMVPACGQAAIAIQTREEDKDRFQPLSDPDTEKAVLLERSFLKALGGGCHTAFAGYSDGEQFHAFHEDFGHRVEELPSAEEVDDFFADRFSDWVTG